MATKKDILEILGLISVAFPNFKMVQSGEVSTADAYMSFLGDLPADALKIAALKCCSENGRVFAPSVGEIRGAVSEIQRKAQGIPTALEAWDEVCKAPKPYPAEYVIYRGGELVEHPVYKWSHPLVEKTARAFGWPDFPKFDNESTERAHFFKHYEGATTNEMNDIMELPEVTRYIDAHNEKIKQLTERLEYD